MIVGDKHPSLFLSERQCQRKGVLWHCKKRIKRTFGLSCLPRNIKLDKEKVSKLFIFIFVFVETVFFKFSKLKKFY
jgi:hypothetical protein